MKESIELARMSGVIIRHDGVTVAVEFPEPDLTIDFPAVLFDVDLAKYGQPVDYIVIQSANGGVYQIFERRNGGENPILPELTKILETIP